MVGIQEGVCARLRLLLEQRGFDVCCIPTAMEVLHLAANAPFEVIVCDLEHFGLSRSTFQAALQRVHPGLARHCLFIASSGSPADARERHLCQRPIASVEVLAKLDILLAETTLKESAVSASHEVLM